MSPIGKDRYDEPVINSKFKQKTVMVENYKAKLGLIDRPVNDIRLPNISMSR